RPAEGAAGDGQLLLADQRRGAGEGDEVEAHRDADALNGVLGDAEGDGPVRAGRSAPTAVVCSVARAGVLDDPYRRAGDGQLGLARAAGGIGGDGVRQV